MSTGSAMHSLLGTLKLLGIANARTQQDLWQRDEADLE